MNLTAEFKIPVNYDDILYGVRHSCEECPLALAIYRILGHLITNVRVRNLLVAYNLPGDNISEVTRIAWLDNIGVSLIEMVDAGRPASPCIVAATFTV